MIFRTEMVQCGRLNMSTRGWDVCQSSEVRSCFLSNINYFTVYVGLSGQISRDKEILDPL